MEEGGMGLLQQHYILIESQNGKLEQIKLSMMGINCNFIKKKKISRK